MGFHTRDFGHDVILESAQRANFGGADEVRVNLEAVSEINGWDTVSSEIRKARAKSFRERTRGPDCQVPEHQAMSRDMKTFSERLIHLAAHQPIGHVLQRRLSKNALEATQSRMCQNDGARCKIAHHELCYSTRAKNKAEKDCQEAAGQLDDSC